MKVYPFGEKNEGPGSWFDILRGVGLGSRIELSIMHDLIKRGYGDYSIEIGSLYKDRTKHYKNRGIDPKQTTHIKVSENYDLLLKYCRTQARKMTPHSIQHRPAKPKESRKLKRIK